MPLVCSLRPAGRIADEIAAAGVPVASLGWRLRPPARPRRRRPAPGVSIDVEGIDVVHSSSTAPTCWRAWPGRWRAAGRW
ncbi:MAG: hypothetical protein U0802_22750 [Candidatus Binatia bacterium]